MQINKSLTNYNMGRHKVLGLIPARIGSKRLKEKNIRLVNGKPMIYYAINVCKESKYIDDFIVSTESDKIKYISEKYGAKVDLRPDYLSKDKVPTQDIFKYVAQIFEFDILALVQANSPQVKVENVDKAIRLMIENDLWEVRCVDANGLENSAFWIVKRDAIFWNGLSCYFGVVNDNAIDIHTEADLDKVNRMMINNEG